MKGIVVIMLVMTGLVAGPAQAARNDGRNPATTGAATEAVPLALPAETLAAFEDIAMAAEARVRGEDLSRVDGDLADGIERLAASLGEIESDTVFAASIYLDTQVLGAEIAVRVAGGGPDEAALGPAMSRLAESKIEWLRNRTHAGSEGPDSGCFTNLRSCYVYCSGLPTAIERSACGLDCQLDFMACIFDVGAPLIDIISVVAPLLNRVKPIP